MARHLLCHATQSAKVTPDAIEFSCLQHGKPIVQAPPEAAQPFNIAHTDGLVLCGIAPQHHLQLGVDVERLDRRTDTELAARYFSAPEVEYVFSFSNETCRHHAFLKVWTLKEAFIKAIGTGLHTPLANFAFENIDSTSPTIRMLSPELESNLNWRFFSCYPRDSFIAAIAVAANQDEAAVSMELHDFDSFVHQNSASSDPKGP
ncbi:4'-phosphopantetheinyl transferase sfp [Planctomycetes bacterium CA13]|uniref:4'-phosphopantetheinyl transferase sfp n=1 Tax=Novipirellula herctigrandis TaxID=2527986 RepID=A0A5C5Z4N7_9BACT|nr:4'-phosphopantetheinyl transferase sfp [Planctomycetes bacterium CA13]